MITRTQFTTVTNDLTELYNYLQENATEYFDNFTMTEDKACIDCFIDGVKALEIFYYNNLFSYAKTEYKASTKGPYLAIALYNNTGVIAFSLAMYSETAPANVVETAVKTKHGLFFRLGKAQNNSITPFTNAMPSDNFPAWFVISKTNYEKTGIMFISLYISSNNNTKSGLTTCVHQSQTSSAVSAGNNSSFVLPNSYSGTNYASVSGTMTILMPIPCKRLNDIYPQEYFPHVFYTPMRQHSSYFVPVEIEGKKYVGNSLILLEDE